VKPEFQRCQISSKTTEADKKNKYITTCAFMKILVPFRAKEQY